MAVHDYHDLMEHVGHRIVCMAYGEDLDGVSLECETCHEVLVSYDKY